MACSFPQFVSLRWTHSVASEDRRFSPSALPAAMQIRQLIVGDCQPVHAFPVAPSVGRRAGCRFTGGESEPRLFEWLRCSVAEGASPNTAL